MLVLVIVFLLGLCVGSFLNCVIYRLALPNFSLKNLGGLKNRSYCPHCKHKLNWYDLIPLLSFLILRGKCRYCKKPISFQYPLVEFATGILFVLLLNYELRIMNYEFFKLEFILNSLFLILTFSFLIIIFVYDLKHYIIPDKIVFPAIGITFLYRLFQVLKFGHWNLIGNWKLEIGNFLGAAFGASAFFLFIVLVSQGKWMGLGDVKLAFLMGLLLGFPAILVALFSAFFVGAIIGIGLVIFGRKKLKSEIPFGPFLVGGTFVAIFWGQDLINWYLNILT